MSRIENRDRKGRTAPDYFHTTAQINGRGELPIPVKVQYDEDYILQWSFGFDLRILGLTIIRVANRSGVTH
jgi:O-antigen biosynthesis protein WbqP